MAINTHNEPNFSGNWLQTENPNTLLIPSTLRVVIDSIGDLLKIFCLRGMRNYRLPNWMVKNLSTPATDQLTENLTIYSFIKLIMLFIFWIRRLFFLNIFHQIFYFAIKELAELIECIQINPRCSLVIKKSYCISVQTSFSRHVNKF